LGSDKIDKPGVLSSQATQTCFFALHHIRLTQRLWPNRRPNLTSDVLKNCCADLFSFASTFLFAPHLFLRLLIAFDRRIEPEHLQYTAASPQLRRYCTSPRSLGATPSRRLRHNKPYISTYFFRFLSAAAARVPGQPPIMSSPRRRIETDVSHESATGSHLEDDPAAWGLTDCLLCCGGNLGHEVRFSLEQGERNSC
jgi:hypothetical protein